MIANKKKKKQIKKQNKKKDKQKKKNSRRKDSFRGNHRCNYHRQHQSELVNYVNSRVTVNFLFRNYNACSRVESVISGRPINTWNIFRNGLMPRQGSSSFGVGGRLKHPSGIFRYFNRRKKIEFIRSFHYKGSRNGLRRPMEEQTNYTVERNIEKGEPGEAITSNDDRSAITRRGMKKEKYRAQDRATRIQLRSGKIRTGVYSRVWPFIESRETGPDEIRSGELSLHPMALAARHHRRRRCRRCAETFDGRRLRSGN